MNLEYVLGLTFGIAVGVGIVALLFRKKVLDMTFDERQERSRGKAYQYGFFTLAAAAMVYGLTDVWFDNWCDTIVGCFICICIGGTVFAVTCILNDAYLSLKEQPKKIMTSLLVASLLNLALGAANVMTGQAVVDGKLAAGSVNLICGVMCAVITVVYIVNFFLGQREEAE